MADNEYFGLKGVKLQWAHLAKPNSMSDKYQVDLVELDKTAVKRLKDAGLTVKHGKDKKEPKPEIGHYVTAKANPYEDGRNPVVMVDAKLNPVEDASIIGNGTIANVNLSAYDWNYNGKTGRSCGLKGVQIIQLIERASPGGAFNEEDGFVAQPAIATATAADTFFEDDVPN